MKTSVTRQRRREAAEPWGLGLEGTWEGLGSHRSYLSLFSFLFKSYLVKHEANMDLILG